MNRRLSLRVLARQLRLPGLPIWHWRFNASNTRLVCALCGMTVARKMTGVHLTIWHPPENNT